MLMYWWKSGESEEIVRIHSLNFSIVNADDSITQLTEKRVEQYGMILHFWRYWLQSANGRPNSKYYSYSWITSCPLSVVGICKYDEISLSWLCYVIWKKADSCPLKKSTLDGDRKGSQKDLKYKKDLMLA